MAMQASGINRQCQRHLLGSEIVRRHIPNLFFRVPIDRRLKPVPVLLEEIGPSSPSRAEEIPHLLPSIERPGNIVAGIAEPHPPSLFGHPVVNSRSDMLE